MLLSFVVNTFILISFLFYLQEVKPCHLSAEVITLKQGKLFNSLIAVAVVTYQLVFTTDFKSRISEQVEVRFIGQLWCIRLYTKFKYSRNLSNRQFGHKGSMIDLKKRTFQSTTFQMTAKHFSISYSGCFLT